MGKTVVVEDGQSIDSIAFDEGFAPDTIWALPENAALKEQRTDRTTLLPGDEVVVPDKRSKVEVRETDLVHRFSRRGVPALFRLRYLINDKPLIDEAYLLEFKGKRLRGCTDSTGEFAVRLPPDVREATLYLGRFGPIPLRFGRLDPIESLRGVKQRLTNLGYRCDPADDPFENDALRIALRQFQSDVGLPVSGARDADTLDALRIAHDRNEP